MKNPTYQRAHNGIHVLVPIIAKFIRGCLHKTLTKVVNMSEVVATRIPKELKKQMEAQPDVNWSEIIREAIIKKLSDEQLRKAKATEDRLRLKTTGTSHIVLAQVIREERDSR